MVSVGDVTALDRAGDRNDNGADQALKTTIIPGRQKRNKTRRTPLHLRVWTHLVFCTVDMSQYFQLIHLYLQRQLQKGMATLLVIFSKATCIPGKSLKLNSLT